MTIAILNAMETNLPAAYWAPVSALHKWLKNPRRNDQAVPEVARSIRKFGFVAPVVVWQSRDRLVAGHTRIAALESILAKSRPAKPVESSSLSGLKDNQGAGHLNERKIVVRDLFPADAQTTKVIMPAVGSLNDPASWLLSANGTRQWILPAPTNVWPDAACSCLPLGLLIVVAFIEADVLRSPRSARSS